MSPRTVKRMGAARAAAKARAGIPTCKEIAIEMLAVLKADYGEQEKCGECTPNFPCDGHIVITKADAAL